MRASLTRKLIDAHLVAGKPVAGEEKQYVALLLLGFVVLLHRRGRAAHRTTRSRRSRWMN